MVATRLSENEASVIRWVGRLLTQPLCFIDTETTGKDTTDEVIQVAGYTMDNGVLGGARSWLCKPRRAIHPMAQAAHGLTPKMLEGEPDFMDVYPEISEWYSGRVMVAYNAIFDRRLLWQTCALRGVSFLPRRFECAMTAYSKFVGQWDEYHGNYKWWKLEQACKRHGVTLDNAHEATADALATAHLLLALWQIQTQS